MNLRNDRTDSVQAAQSRNPRHIRPVSFDTLAVDLVEAIAASKESWTPEECRSFLQLMRVGGK